MYLRFRQCVEWSMAVSKEQQVRLERLAAAPDEEIDTSDIPDVLDWSGAIRGGLYKTREEAITIRLDADVLAWFRDHAEGGRPGLPIRDQPGAAAVCGCEWTTAGLTSRLASSFSGL